MAATKRRVAGPVHLLDGNVLVALISHAHVHHAAAQRWFRVFIVSLRHLPHHTGHLASTPPAPG